jgi:hypothetical protein
VPAGEARTAFLRSDWHDRVEAYALVACLPLLFVEVLTHPFFHRRCMLVPLLVVFACLFHRIHMLAERGGIFEDQDAEAGQAADAYTKVPTG